MKTKYWIKKNTELTELAKKLFDGVDSVYLIQENYSNIAMVTKENKRSFINYCNHHDKQKVSRLDNVEELMIKFKSGKHTMISSSEWLQITSVTNDSLEVL